MPSGLTRRDPLAVMEFDVALTILSPAERRSPQGKW